MKIKLYQVDAFAQRVFEGNPAAVCPLDRWLGGELMQAIANENNLSETAFFVPDEESVHLRWFTPTAEVDLCGHATLAAAHVLFEILAYPRPTISFKTRSGTLLVERSSKGLAMDFPASVPKPCVPPQTLLDGLGQRPIEVLAGDDYIAVFENEAAIRALAPDLEKLRVLDRRGVCITAPGDEADFVSRFFAPKFGIAEDPVTGSVHCVLAPYWSKRLGKGHLHARQVSRRGGDVHCGIKGNRVILSGSAVTFMTAEIDIDVAAP